MSDKPIDIGPGTLFNAHMSDLGNRMTTFCNFLLLVDGGILSITIAAFLGATPPSLALDGLFAIRNGWYLLTAGMILAVSIPFFLLLAQLSVHRQWKESIPKRLEDQKPALQLFTGPRWVGCAVRIALWLAFITSVIGIICVSYGAVQALRLPIAAPSK